MGRVLWAAAGLAVAGVMTGAVSAAPGQCSFTGYGSFGCDVVLDGGGITFGLPDGQVFAFALTAPDEGQGYLIGAEARPGQRPRELGRFTSVPEEAGCWTDGEDLQFCAQVEQRP